MNDGRFQTFENRGWAATPDAETSLFDEIVVGARVSIVNRFSQVHAGRAVMRGPAGWVLNMGGAHGTPAIATPENVVAVRLPKKGGR